jgi:hypothetical protein
MRQTAGVLAAGLLLVTGVAAADATIYLHYADGTVVASNAEELSVLPAGDIDRRDAFTVTMNARAELLDSDQFTIACMAGRMPPREPSSETWTFSRAVPALIGRKLIVIVLAPTAVSLRHRARDKGLRSWIGRHIVGAKILRMRSARSDDRHGEHQWRHTNSNERRSVRLIVPPGAR